MSDAGIYNETRLNVRVKGLMADHVNALIGPQGIYENQSEYIRDLIRHDMEVRQEEKVSFYEMMLRSLDSPTHDLEDDYFDKKRAKLKRLQNH